jgi:hypothetical protein
MEGRKNMKRLMLFASLCVAAAVLAPVAAASAAQVKGSCKIDGKASFTTKLPFLEPGANKYAFKGAFKCKVEGKEVESEGTAEVTGEGKLACAVSHGGVAVVGSGGPGPGTLKETSPGKEEYKFNLAFVAAAGNVLLDVRNEKEETTATGDAEFLTPGEPLEKAATLQKCVKGEVEELAFVALAAGTIGE